MGKLIKNGQEIGFVSRDFFENLKKAYGKNVVNEKDNILVTTRNRYLWLEEDPVQETILS